MIEDVTIDYHVRREAEFWRIATAIMSGHSWLSTCLFEGQSRDPWMERLSPGDEARYRLVHDPVPHRGRVVAVGWRCSHCGRFIDAPPGAFYLFNGEPHFYSGTGLGGPAQHLRPEPHDGGPCPRKRAAEDGQDWLDSRAGYG